MIDLRRRVPGLLAFVLLPCVFAPAARAVTLAPKIFVASTGSDASTGAQNAPKRTSAAALVADDCTVCDGHYGVASGGGTLISRGTNTFFDNSQDGSFDQTLAAK